LTSFSAVSAAEFADRAAALRPALRDAALATENNRRVPPANVELLRAAGLFKLYQPERYGGYELSYGRLQLAVSTYLGSACASTAWMQSVMASHAWITANFLDVAQRTVWGDHPDALVATAFSTTAGVTVERAANGLVLDGTWEFSSGCESADWIILRAPIVLETGMTSMLCLIPRSELEIVDIWYAAGLRGSGSQNVRARSVFVADAMTLDILALRGSPTPLYGLPFMGVFPYTVAAPALGVARGAIDAFREETLARPERTTQTVRQLRYARSAAEVDSAELVLSAVADRLESATRERRIMTSAERVLCKRDMSFATLLSKQAVERLAGMLGAHGTADAHPIQRANRDLAAIASHFGLNWDNAGELYSSVAFGLAPKDPMAL
jgi:alkylation response protein AidB-like acyl-CoA dehydrogenase